MGTDRAGDHQDAEHDAQPSKGAYFDTAVNGWLMRATGTDITALPALGVVAQTACRFHGRGRRHRIVNGAVDLIVYGTLDYAGDQAD